MDLENKRLYRWLPWIITVAVTVLFSALLFNELMRKQQDWQLQLELRSTAAQNSLMDSQQDLIRHASVLGQIVVDDPAVIALIQQAYKLQRQDTSPQSTTQANLVRNQLKQLLLVHWNRMAPLGVRELNIHLGVNATVFLRAGQPDRYGDDIAPFSPMVLSALKSGSLTTGVEVGHFGTSVKAIVPVYTDNRVGNEAGAAVEVGLMLLPPREKAGVRGQAVLIKYPLINELLWGETRQNVLANSKNANSPWAVEHFTNSVIKDWQTQGLLTADLVGNKAPWVLRDENKYFLLSTYPLNGLVQLNAPPTAPKAVIVDWQEITAEKLENNSETQFVWIKNASEWIFAEILILILFRFNRRYIFQLLRDHGQQLQKERDLSEQARQRLNLALVSSESGFWEWNIETNRALFSKEWRELCGLGEADKDGHADIEEWLTLVHPADKRTSYTEMIRHIKGETPMFENEYRLKVADGSYKWIFTRGKVVEWQPDGRAALMLGVYTDITERKKNEIIVVRQQAALRALNEIASMPVLNAEDQLRRALGIGGRYLGLPIGAVSRVQGNQHQIKLKIGPELNNPVDVLNPLSNFFCEFTIRHQEIFCCDDISSSEFVNHYAYKRSRVDSYIGVPVWLKGKMYGTLSFSSDRCRHQEFDDLDKDFMRLLARWVGVTMERWEHQTEQQGLIDRFDKLCSQLPGFLYQYQLNTDGTSAFPFSSSGIEEIYGVRPDEVKTDASKVFSYLHPEEVGWISEGISRSAATLKLWSAVYRVRHPRRGIIWVRGEARPERLADGGTLWNGYIQEITEEKLAAIKLQEINALREAIFDAASFSIISTDENGLIKTFNRGAEKMLGYSAAEVINILTPAPFHLVEEVVAQAEKLSQEFGVKILPGFDVFVARVREGDEDEQEWTYVCKNGKHINIILSVSALRNPDGEITGYLGIARDISEIKRIDRMKSEFISTVSHELRTPLTAINGSLGIIVNGAAGAIPDTATKMLNIAHKNSLRLIHLVNDLLDMEKLVAGKMHFEMIAQPLLPLLQQSFEANAAYAAQYNVKFVLDNTVDEDFRITVDSQRLQQVLANFLSNAAKFSPENDFVTVKTEKIYNSVRVTVMDNGQGIPDEFRNRIFQKFSQADSSDSRQKGGTGLGLAICKEIIERMGGKVGFNSEHGKGSQFYFELPCEEKHGAHHERLEQRLPTGERLLIVEDDPEVADLLATILRNQNFRVDIAYSGQTALERLALYPYQLITLDIELPDIDGVSLIKQLRSDSTSQRLPIVVISANIDSERVGDRNDPVFAGIQWLQKPQQPEALVDAVKKTLVSAERNKVENNKQ